jgi:hypothetical protein
VRWLCFEVNSTSQVKEQLSLPNRCKLKRTTHWCAYTDFDFMLAGTTAKAGKLVDCAFCFCLLNL